MYWCDIVVMGFLHGLYLIVCMLYRLHVYFQQVVLRSGRVIGAREVKVSTDRVNVDRLDVGVVSGLSVSVDKKADFPGALAVLVTKTKTLHNKYQVWSFGQVLVEKKNSS